SSGLVRERPAVKFAAIADWAASKEYPVDFMCRELGVSSSGYYAWLKATPSQRATDDADLIAIMKKLHADGRGNPGVRRMRGDLAALGHNLSHKRVWRGDEGRWPARTPPEGVAAHHHRRRCAGERPRPDRPELPREATQPEMDQRHHLRQDLGRPRRTCAP